MTYDTDAHNPDIEIEDVTADMADEVSIEEMDDRSEAKIKSLREKLHTAEEEKRQHLEDLQRTKAEFLNAKKRLEESAERSIDKAVDDHIEKLLPLCDSFHMAMKNTEVWENVEENWRNSVEGVYKNLLSILSQYGAESFDPTGTEFDPTFHDAVGTREDVAADDTIVEVLQLGYKRNGEIIRPAKVILSI